MAATTTAAPTATPSTRERLIAAAIDVFRAQGYERARVQDIARAAGLTTGAIYANYRGKADLLLDAIATGSAAEVDAMLRAVAELEPRALLEALGGRLLHHRRGDRPLLLEAIVAARRDPELGTHLRERFGARAQQLTAVVDRGKHTGSIDTDLSTDALVAFCTTLALGALVARTLDLPAPDHQDWDILVARLLDAVAPTPEEMQ